MQTYTADEALNWAFAAYSLGDLRETLRRIDRYITTHGPTAELLHLRALSHKGLGEAQEAAIAFASAHQINPVDVQVLTNWGNLLTEEDDLSTALTLYGRALSVDPEYGEALFNRALALQRLHRYDEALDDLDRALARNPEMAKAYSARGAILRAAEMPNEAIEAFDRALAIEPSRAVALAGRARLALETGAADAKDRYIAALEQTPGQQPLVLGIVQAMFAEGDGSGLDILEDVLRQNPLWFEGHYEFALLRAEYGEGPAFTDHIREAISRIPNEPQLYATLANALASAERYSEALEALREAEARCPPDNSRKFEIARLEAECGNRDAAWHELASFPDSDLVRQVRGRLALRLGKADEAALLLEELVARSPDDIFAWAYLGVAWRLLEDDRFAWLAEQPGLTSTQILDLPASTMQRIAEVLRNIHRARAQPVGQSLRGGTQTRGRLFWRHEPELNGLASKIGEAVQAHLSGLPAADQRHPLLRHRDSILKIKGSWSVRLTDQGFHVQHIHPEGILSSACYIVVPPVSGDDIHAGWLEIGGAPHDLDLRLDPLSVVQPESGKLALFPSYMFHGTRPFAAGERLTVAFDVVPSN
jgi:tetratricopeptide (TPR) repeat protein